MCVSDMWRKRNNNGRANFDHILAQGAVVSLRGTDRHLSDTDTVRKPTK